MTSNIKYSWAEKQKSRKKIKSLMKKSMLRSSLIIAITLQLKVIGINVSVDFLENQLDHYLRERRRWAQLCAVLRNISGAHKLVSKEIWEGYTFEKYKNKSKHDINTFYENI